MKNICLVSYFLLFFTFNLLANKDSLWTVWKDNSVADTIRLDAFRDYIYDYYLFNSPDSADLLANQQLDFATKTGRKF